MHPRLFRLIETLQRIDARLGQERLRQRPDGLTLFQLRRLKARTKQLIDRFTLRPERI